MTREERAREAVAQAITSKHWAGLVREGKDDDWGVIKCREAIAACLAFADAEAAAMRERAAETVESPDAQCPGLPDEHWSRKHIPALAAAIRALPGSG